MLCSPRRPSSTTRIFSSAEKCRRVARRMSLIVSSASCFSYPDFCLIFAPCGYDDPEILPTRKPRRVSKVLMADTRGLERNGFDSFDLKFSWPASGPTRAPGASQPALRQKRATRAGAVLRLSVTSGGRGDRVAHVADQAVDQRIVLGLSHHADDGFGARGADD
jgi:hypothetical protein